MVKGNGMSVDLSRPAGPLARTVEDRARGAWDTSGSVTCQGCRYPNPISQSFYALSVQNLYCRKCGRMIDRDGRLAVPS